MTGVLRICNNKNENTTQHIHETYTKHDKKEAYTQPLQTNNKPVEADRTPIETYGKPAEACTNTYRTL